ncbi:MAG: RAMP superfamily CRISPR-associated protein [Bacteroidales bacterium]|nr:RAMP superfamily CRISPR-associated protein [Bacteroidales bacterium]
MKTLIKKIKVSAKLRLETGLHIGGSKDNVEIGGIDTPVIKIATRKNQPYIPGSSLKGKIRSLLEQINGKELCGDDNINDLSRIIHAQQL